MEKANVRQVRLILIGSESYDFVKIAVVLKLHKQLFTATIGILVVSGCD
jgi:hypothetical protein